MEFRLATESDIPMIEKIYCGAREFMKISGNPLQWGAVYPPRELLKCDIALGRLYALCNCGEIVAVFVFFIGEDPTYLKIYDIAIKNSSLI